MKQTKEKKEAFYNALLENPQVLNKTMKKEVLKHMEEIEKIFDGAAKKLDKLQEKEFNMAFGVAMSLSLLSFIERFDGLGEADGALGNLMLLKNNLEGNKEPPPEYVG